MHPRIHRSQHQTWSGEDLSLTSVHPKLVASGKFCPPRFRGLDPPSYKTLLRVSVRVQGNNDFYTT